MTLDEYVDGLIRLLEENKEYGKLEVVYSVDDEGNAIDFVKYEPTVGALTEDKDFVPAGADEFEELELHYNAICIN